jgi:hypothetical protein
VRHYAILVLAAGLLTVPAFAQQPAEPAPAQPPVQKLDPKACSDRDRAKVGDTGDTHETQGSAGPKDSLSDKLARTDGVICPPPEIDPDMHQPAPGGGATPVIPPPGSPGGDPSVQPK